MKARPAPLSMMTDATCSARRIETPTTHDTTQPALPTISERHSSIHGLGVHALKAFEAGECITELLGERITAEESDHRAELLPDTGHTFFFSVDDDLVLDCAVNGNSARFINHHCDPNCEAIIEGDQVFIYALRDINVGQELTYDYNIGWSVTEAAAELAQYACRCGAATCRGTMLSPAPVEADLSAANDQY
jgi:SET domain-containing protein